MKRQLLVGLSTIHQGENVFEFRHEPEDLGLAPCEVCENPSFERLIGTMQESVTVMRDGTRLLLKGRVAFRALLRCAICNQEYERDFDEELMAEVIDLGRSLTLPKDQAEPACDDSLIDGDMLDITAIVRDAVHLAIPIAPMCRQGCRGICPVCGINLNQSDCRCSNHP